MHAGRPAIGISRDFAAIVDAKGRTGSAAGQNPKVLYAVRSGPVEPMKIVAGDCGFSDHMSESIDALGQTVTPGQRAQILHALAFAPKNRMSVCARTVGAAGNLPRVIVCTRYADRAAGQSA